MACSATASAWACRRSPPTFRTREFTGNVLAGGSADRYPAGNRFSSVNEVMAQFADPAAGNFRLRPESWARRASSDGGAAGADLDAIYRAMEGVGLR